MKNRRRNMIMTALVMGSLALTACSSNEDNAAGGTGQQKAEQPAKSNSAAAKKEKTVEQALPPIKEAKGVPVQERKAIMSLLNQYVAAFNKQDINAYLKTLSPHSTSFKLDDEKQFMQKTFKKTNIQMKPKQILIIDYKGNQANVFTDMDTVVIDRSSGERVKRSSRQILTLVKEEGGWKITRLFAMENQ